MTYEGTSSLCPIPTSVALGQAQEERVYVVADTAASLRTEGCSYEGRPLVVVNGMALFLDRLTTKSVSRLDAAGVKVREFVRGESVTIKALA